MLMPPQNVQTSGLRGSEMYIGSFRLKSVSAPSGAQCYFCGEFGKQSSFNYCLCEIAVALWRIARLFRGFRRLHPRLYDIARSGAKENQNTKLNQAKLCCMSETFRIGIRRFACMAFILRSVVRLQERERMIARDEDWVTVDANATVCYSPRVLVRAMNDFPYLEW